MSAKRAAGSCLCGAVRFEITFPTRFCAHCHCSNCRRAHGAAFATWVGVPEAQFRLLAGESTLTRYRTATEATRSFCGTCGSTLLYQGPRWPGEVHVARSNIDDAIDREPSAHVYVDHRADWWEITDALPRLGGTSADESKPGAGES